MADPREGPGKAPTPGRDANAAQPHDAADNKGGPERYPRVRQDDAIERGGMGEWARSFDAHEADVPREEADASRDGGQKDFEGPQADPAEGKPDLGR